MMCALHALSYGDDFYIYSADDHEKLGTAAAVPQNQVLGLFKGALLNRPLCESFVIR